MRALLAGLIVVTCLFTSARSAEKWPEFDPVEFKQTASKIDPEAGAEIISREVTLDHDELPHEQTVALRIRIYDQKGVEAHSKIEIPYSADSEVRDIQARVIFPNGTIRELNRKDIYDREVLKVGKFRSRVKSFAPPGLEPGVVIEYRYTLIEDYPRWFSWFTYQSDIPTRTVLFRFRSFLASGFGVRFLSVRSPQPPAAPNKQRFFELRMNDLPAWKEEKFSPPTTNLQPALFLFYTDRSSVKPEIFWPQLGTRLAEEGEQLVRKNSAVTAVVSRLFPATAEPTAKLRALFDYVRTKVSNRARLPYHQRAKLPVNRTPADTLKNASGTPEDINRLFFALATAAGLDARLVKCGDREEMLFNTNLTEEFVVPDDAVAVRVGDAWKYFQPGKSFIPFGTLDWRNSDNMLLVAAKKDAKLVAVLGADPALSSRNREGRFKLDSTGTLSGDVTITYTGLAAVDLKENLDDLDLHQREEFIRDQVKDIFKDADISKIQIEGATEHDGPVTVTYTLKVPEYAERTGTRLFLQPAVFQKNAPPLFPETERRNDVIFRYRYTHRDTFDIQPPAGYSLEAASAPAKLDVPGFCNYDVSISVREKSGGIIYHRTFTLLRVEVPVKNYPSLRNIFDIVRSRDQHALTLKRDAAPASAGSASAPPPAPVAPTEAAKSESSPL